MNSAAAINQHTSSGNSKEHSQSDEKPTTDNEKRQKQNQMKLTKFIIESQSKQTKITWTHWNGAVESRATVIQKHHVHLMRLLKMIAGQLIAQFKKKKLTIKKILNILNYIIMFRALDKNQVLSFALSRRVCIWFDNATWKRNLLQNEKFVWMKHRSNISERARRRQN